MTTAPPADVLKARSLARRWPDLERSIFRGEAGRQVLWQPRILAWRADKLYFGEPLPSPYDTLSKSDMFRHLDCATRAYAFNRCFQLQDDPAVTREHKQLSNTQQLTVFHTPVGEQTEIREQRPTCRMAIYMKRPIVTKEDLRVATWRTERMRYTFDRRVHDELMEEWGDLGLPVIYFPRPNIQNLYIEQMGVEAAIYALHDWGDQAFEPYFNALDLLAEQLIDLLNGLPEYEAVNFGDNVHASTLSPRLFEKYVLPTYQYRCERFHQCGKFVHAHWDGDVGPLLPYVQDTGLDGIEAITPKPQGDVTLEQVKDALGDKIVWLDGIPAIYFDQTYSVSELRAFTHRIIDMFAGQLILGISDELSSHGDIERVRIVGQIVDEHNASLTTGTGMRR
jgi:hypothetical protein